MNSVADQSDPAIRSADELTRKDRRGPWLVRPRVRRADALDPDDLVRRLAAAKACLPALQDPALYDAIDEGELAAEQRLHRWIRAHRRRDRQIEVRRERASKNRSRRTTERILASEQRELRWHARARAERRRATSPDALEGMLHRRATWSSLRLRAVIVVGLVWSAVNVGRNLVPEGGPTGASWWLLWLLSFGIEAMISVPILEVMAQAATAARLGVTVERRRILLFEACLLTATVGLNSGPHLAAGDLGRAAEYAVAPVMVVVLMWLHAWLAARYARLINMVSPTGTLDETSDSTNRAVDGDHGADQTIQPLQVDDYPASVMAQTTAPPAHASGLVASTSERSVGSVETPPHHQPLPQQQVELPERVLIDVSEPDQCRRIARELVRGRLTQKPETEIEELLRLAQRGVNANAIATELSRITGVKWTRSTVDRIVGRAESMGFRIGSRQGVGPAVTSA
ncbi:hypothetical protein [Nocardia abscessus]|uniref:hypothetical protein n=1 Tax=Nocardia abscessus TaxID=120957 RepID=UPI002453FEBE|nr:hypothetical protein [Nocardia abscessus]